MTFITECLCVWVNPVHKPVKNKVHRSEWENVILRTIVHYLKKKRLRPFYPFTALRILST